jgi:uncharacterized protein
MVATTLFVGYLKLMELSRDNGNANYQIQSYQEDCIVVNGIRYLQSIIITASQLISPWGPASIDEMRAKDLEIVIPLKPQVILLGTGKQQKRPAIEVLMPLIEHNIGFEIMDTRAACRTYTLLAAEGRNVAAALLI